jgi:hypothetical protein
VTGEEDNPMYFNYWEIDLPGSWLSQLAVRSKRFLYFGAMSAAMAVSCGGTVYVMSVAPYNMDKYISASAPPNIWALDEWPNLRDRYKAGGVGAPTSLVAVDAVNPSTQVLLDWYTLKPANGAAPPKEARLNDTEGDGTVEELVASGAFGERDTCSQNVNYEGPGEDWFGVIG